MRILRNSDPGLSPSAHRPSCAWRAALGAASTGVHAGGGARDPCARRAAPRRVHGVGSSSRRQHPRAGVRATTGLRPGSGRHHHRPTARRRHRPTARRRRRTAQATAVTRKHSRSARRAIHRSPPARATSSRPSAADRAKDVALCRPSQYGQPVVATVAAVAVPQVQVQTATPVQQPGPIGLC